MGYSQRIWPAGHHSSCENKIEIKNIVLLCKSRIFNRFQQWTFTQPHDRAEKLERIKSISMTGNEKLTKMFKNLLTTPNGHV
jgi:hypothetical protein